MKILLFSRERAEVVVNGKSAMLNFANPLVLQSGQVVKVFPLAENLLPFCFVAGENHKCLKTVAFRDYHLVEITNFPRVFVGRCFKQKNFSGGTFGVVGSPFVFNVSTKSQSLVFNLPDDLSAVELHETKNALFVRANQGQNAFLAAFHKANGQFLAFCGNVDFSESKISVVANKNTLAGHGQMIAYSITPMGFEKITQEPVYLQRQPKAVPPFLTHIAFFEAVREKDYFLAKTYLADDLAQKLSAQHFHEFFGEFDAIKVLSVNNQTRLALIKENGQNPATATVFELDFAESKITDIRPAD